MKSTVQTRIFISLTTEEARAAVNNAIDLQLCIRSALYQIDGTPVATLIEQNRRQLTAPHSAKNKRKLTVHTRTAARRAPKIPNAERIECPQCHKPVKARGLGVHMARKHKPSSVETGGLIFTADNIALKKVR